MITHIVDLVVILAYNCTIRVGGALSQRAVTRVEFLKLYKDENIDIMINNCLERNMSPRDMRVTILDYLTTKLYPITAPVEEVDEFYNTGRLVKKIHKPGTQ